MWPPVSVVTVATKRGKAFLEFARRCPSAVSGGVMSAVGGSARSCFNEEFGFRAIPRELTRKTNNVRS